MIAMDENEVTMTTIQHSKIKRALKNKDRIIVVGDSFAACSETMLWLTANIPTEYSIAVAECGDSYFINDISATAEYKPCLRLEDLSTVKSKTTGKIDWLVVDEVGGQWGLTELDAALSKGTGMVAVINVDRYEPLGKDAIAYAKDTIATYYEERLETNRPNEKLCTVLVHVDLIETSDESVEVTVLSIENI